VLCAAETAALWAGRRAEQHQATGQVERLQSEATNINAVPLANLQSPIRRMPGLKRLLVDWGAQLRCCGGEAAPAGSLLATAHGSNDADTAIRTVDSNLDRASKELVVEPIFNGERFKGKCATRRFGEEWREINGIEGRHQRRRFALHRLRLRRSSSRSSSENWDHGGGHESVQRSAIARNLANETA
jgi:hypothetical protein